MNNITADRAVHTFAGVAVGAYVAHWLTMEYVDRQRPAIIIDDESLIEPIE